MEDVKHDVEQTVADSDENNLRKDAKDTVKGWMPIFKKVGDIFSMDCSYTSHSWYLGKCKISGLQYCVASYAVRCV